MIFPAKTKNIPFAINLYKKKHPNIDFCLSLIIELCRRLAT